MTVRPYQLPYETDEQCRERFARIVGPALDEGEQLAAWFDAQVANAPRTMHPTSADIRPTSMIATASVNARRRMAARDPLAELEDEAREQGEWESRCPVCSGTGWTTDDGGESWTECECRTVQP